MSTKTTLKKITKKATEIAKSDKTKKVVDKTIQVVKTPAFLKVLGGAIVLYVGYKAVSTLGNVVEKPQIDNQVGGTGGNITGATITDFEASNYAQQLLDAMNYKFPLYGTDTDTIGEVFNKLITPADFIKVFNAFGKKDYNGHNSPPDGWLAVLDSYEKYNLVYWLKSELSSFLDYSVYNQVKVVVENAGFTF